jgi:5S rRNA maturation endonuclease (ribonuclease M5)
MEREIIIVTEGEFDAEVLEKLLEGKRFEFNYKILPASGYSSALSKVKSLLTFRDKKIILLLDTDSTYETEMREKKEFVNSYINTNFNKEYFKVFWAEPELEVIFLNKKFLTHLPHQKVSNEIIKNEEFLNVARDSPRKTLENLFNTSREELIGLLSNKEIRDEFYKEGLIKEIVDYLENQVVRV